MAPQQISSKNSKLASIQALRAVAALMVVVLHSAIAFSPEDKARLFWWPGFSDFGYLGVSLFFVISGFIVANIVSKPGFKIGPFFWHRFWRIYPLYWIVMAVGLYFYRERNWFAYAVESLGADGMVKSALIFPLQEHPFWEPGWSLEHEVLFYVIAAIVAPVFGLRALAGMMVALGVIGMMFVTFWDWHLFSSYQAYFGAGIVAFLLKDRRWYEAAPVALVLLGCSYSVYYKAFEAPTQVIEFAFAFGCAALIVSLLDAERKGWRVPKAVVLIGDASFSLYLWHWLVIPLTSRWVTAYGGPPEMWRWIIVVVSIVVAIASFYMIEKPIVKFSHKKRRLAAPAE